MNNYGSHPVRPPTVMAAAHRPALNRSDQKKLKGSRFTLGNLAINMAIIAALLLVNKLGALGNLVCYGALFAMALSSSSGALKAISMSAFVIMANPMIVEHSLVVVFVRFALLAAAGGRILYDVVQTQPDILRRPHLIALTVFCGVVMVIAPFNGYFASVAILKAGVFFVGAYAILAGAELNRRSFSDLSVWFIAMITLMVVASYLTIPLGISHVYQGQLMLASQLGMAGVTSHPQTLGVFMSMSAIFLVSLLLYSRLPGRWLFLVLFLACLPLVWWTRSRTALLTIFLAVGLISIFSPLLVNQAKTSFRKVSVVWVVAAILIGTPVVLAVDYYSGGRIADVATGFLFKGRAERVFDPTVMDIAASREGLITRSWQIFLENPVTGINFGTSYDPGFVQRATLLSAPSEKGFIPTAVLEEVGALGAAFFVAFLFVFYRKLHLDGNILGVSALTGFLIINMGEMTFFSLGGPGLFCWALLGAAIAIGQRHQRVF